MFQSSKQFRKTLFQGALGYTLKKKKEGNMLLGRALRFH